MSHIFIKSVIFNSVTDPGHPRCPTHRVCYHWWPSLPGGCCICLEQFAGDSTCITVTTSFPEKTEDWTFCLVLQLFCLMSVSLSDPTLLLRVLAVLGLYATSSQFVIIIIIIIITSECPAIWFSLRDCQRGLYYRTLQWDLCAESSEPGRLDRYQTDVGTWLRMCALCGMNVRAGGTVELFQHLIDFSVFCVTKPN